MYDTLTGGAREMAESPIGGIAAESGQVVIADIAPGTQLPESVLA